MKKTVNIVIWTAVLVFLIIGAYFVYSRNNSAEYIEDKIAEDTIMTKLQVITAGPKRKTR